MFAPEIRSGPGIPKRDLRAPDGRATAADCEPGPVGTESQAPDRVLGTAKAQPPLARGTLPKVDIRCPLADKERPARACSNLASIRTEGNRVDASGGRVHRQALGVTQALYVVPFPAPALERAVVKQAFSKCDIIV